MVKERNGNMIVVQKIKKILQRIRSLYQSCILGIKTKKHPPLDTAFTEDEDDFFFRINGFNYSVEHYLTEEIEENWKLVYSKFSDNYYLQHPYLNLRLRYKSQVYRMYKRKAWNLYDPYTGFNRVICDFEADSLIRMDEFYEKLDLNIKHYKIESIKHGTS